MVLVEKIGVQKIHLTLSALFLPLQPTYLRPKAVVGTGVVLAPPARQHTDMRLPHVLAPCVRCMPAAKCQTSNAIEQAPEEYLTRLHWSVCCAARDAKGCSSLLGVHAEQHALFRICIVSIHQQPYGHCAPKRSGPSTSHP